MIDEEKDVEDIVLFVCGPRSIGKTTLAREMSRRLVQMGLVSSIIDVLPIDYEIEPTVMHKECLRALMEKEVNIVIRTACFSSERVQEVLSRESENVISKPAMLTRIHWHDNVLTEKLFPGRHYLVRISDGWYTGTFCLSPDQKRWEFKDIDSRAIETHKRYALTREAIPTGVCEIYEIVRD